jgi:hypothetical protein
LHHPYDRSNPRRTSPRAERLEASTPMIAVIGNFVAGAVALSLFAATIRLSR